MTSLDQNSNVPIATGSTRKFPTIRCQATLANKMLFCHTYLNPLVLHFRLGLHKSFLLVVVTCKIGGGNRLFALKTAKK